MSNRQKIREIVAGALARLDAGAHFDTTPNDKANMWKEVCNLLTMATSIADCEESKHRALSDSIVSFN